MSKPHIMIVAGETSGDLLGADLMRALCAAQPDTKFSGVGGPAMSRAGFSSLFDMSEIAIMGLGPILANLRRLFGLADLTVAHACETQPDIVVLIDSPEFNHRVAARIKKRFPDVPIVCYVAPSVWAWRRGRARKMAAHFDAVLALFPFETQVFKALSGPPCHFVGHPIIGRVERLGQIPDFRKQHGLGADIPLLCVLPGSRMSEIRKIGPAFWETLLRIERCVEDLAVVIPVLPHTREVVHDMFGGGPFSPILVEDEGEKWAAFKAANAALVSSGTATLELGMAGLPSVVGYRMGKILTAFVLRSLRVPSAVIVNLVLDKPVMEEFLADRCDPDFLTPAVHKLLVDKDLNAEKRRQLAALPEELGAHDAPPDARAAGIIHELMRQT